MTWRERVVAARERGEFSTNDMKMWHSGNTCPVGEAMSVFGIPVYTGEWMRQWNKLDRCDLGDASFRALTALQADDFNGLDQILDELRIEHSC